MRSTLISQQLGRAVVLGIPLALIFVMILGPLAITLVISLWQKVGFSMRPAISFENYAAFFSGTRLDVLLRSLWVGVSSAALMLLLAYPIAYLIATRLRAGLVRPVLFPFAGPSLVTCVVRPVSWSAIVPPTGPASTRSPWRP